jgi:excisionase family DNA binding protein
MRDLHFRASPEPEPSTAQAISVTLTVGAAMLGCTVRALRELIWAGKIRHVRLGKRFVVSPLELRQFIEKELVRL